MGSFTQIPGVPERGAVTDLTGCVVFFARLENDRNACREMHFLQAK